MGPIVLARRSGALAWHLQQPLRRPAFPSAACRFFSTVNDAPPLPAVYERLYNKYATVRRVLGADRRLTLAEKILYSHLDDVETNLLTNTDNGRAIRGQANLQLKPDRVNMQDASAQMALLQFMSCNLPQTAIPASVHCDHLIVGENGAESDLQAGLSANGEVFTFLESAARRYGIDFWPPGAGIIHQTVLENYALPGLMMLGTDSHTPNAGGLCTVAIGVGGADAVEALVGAPWELKAPRILNVRLTGQLSGWVAPKDVILHLAGLLTVRGGTGFIIEYGGPGVETLSCTGMATMANMGAEVGATTSVFPYTAASARYLASTRREQAAQDAARFQEFRGAAATDAAFRFAADEGAEYDEVLEINLSELEPHINGPFTPDLSIPLSAFRETVQSEAWPEKLSAGLIGSCTNSSYEDMTRVESLLKAAADAGLKPVSDFYVTPGSEQIRATLARDGTLDAIHDAGGVLLANACGPCIGQWTRRDGVDKGTPNAIFTSYNRNFRGRNDGNLETMNFLASPELVTAFAFAGSTTFNPLTDSLPTPDGGAFRANTLNTAVNAATGEVNVAYDLDGTATTIPALAQRWRARGQPWLVVAEHNYGEGSAREHAALQPRYLGARLVVAKSFARIHETNLKKQGVVPLTFADEADYARIDAGDRVAAVGLYAMLQAG
ncbi:aconitase [Niveomyces insectorum RCEF 264]|uniref:Aconitase n=1 Tax=Niveomyces insectorum RCEF 264 TaxID=1081102 RepID=A0A168AG12_9HYPO|nr:aconitase [Niveomyces insectorum RCEF 264]